MSFTLVLIGALVLPAAGLATWAWFAMARVEEYVSSCADFEGMHFETAPSKPREGL